MRSTRGMMLPMANAPKKRNPGETLTEAEKVELIKKGEIKRHQLSVRDREVYRDLFDPMKRGRG